MIRSSIFAGNNFKIAHTCFNTCIVKKKNQHFPNFVWKELFLSI